MSYKDRLLAHLGDYRRNVLGVAEPGTFRYDGTERPYEHILPKEQQWLGIPAEVREQVRAYCESKEITLHRYFHHLNSSQAFALSLFVPFFEGGAEAQRALLRALSVDGDLAEWEAERIPAAAEGTNLDAWWRTTDGRQFFCEVKLTEEEFGSAKNDERHQAKLRDIYAPRLTGQVDPALLEEEAFFGAYQFLRNLWQAAGPEGGTVIFLFPRQHESLTMQLNEVLQQVISPLRQRVQVRYAEDVLAALVADESCPAALRAHAAGLAAKYLLGPVQLGTFRSPFPVE